MKKRILYCVITTIVAVLLFPIAVAWIITLSSKICRFLSINPILFITELNTLSFSNYIDFIISSFLFFATLGIGIITYNLSLKIHKTNSEITRKERVYVAEMLLFEIQLNTTIIDNKEKKVEDKTGCISMDSFKMLGTLSPILSGLELSQIIQLYKLFWFYKKTGNISETNRAKWISDSNELKTQEICRALEERIEIDEFD